MDIFLNMLQNYQQNLSAAHVYLNHRDQTKNAKNGDIETIQKALKYFKSADIDLQSAKEYSQSNAELLNLAHTNKEFETWLIKKRLHIHKNLLELKSYIQNLEEQCSLHYHQEHNEFGGSPRRTQSRQQRSRDSFKKHKRKHRSSQETAAEQEDDDWIAIAEKSLNLLHQLRSQQEFNEECERNFEKLIHKRRERKNKDF